MLENTSAFRGDIAVDNSETSTAGNFYVQTGLNVYGYAYDGTPLKGFPLEFSGTPCGVAVDPDGHVWVANRELGTYRQYDAEGNPTFKQISVGVDNAACTVEVDAAGNVYIGEDEGFSGYWGEDPRIVKYDSSLNRIGTFASGRTPTSLPSVPPLVFDRSAPTRAFCTTEPIPTTRLRPKDLITDVDQEGTPIEVFGGPDAAHFSFAGLGNGHDLAVNPQNHDLYVRNKSTVDVFSRDATAITVPTVTTEPATDIEGSGATLSGVVDPDGVDTTQCKFEWGTNYNYNKSVSCAEGNVFTGGSGENEVSASISGLTKGTLYHFRLTSKNANGVLAYGKDLRVRASDPPIIADASLSHITTDAGQVGVKINPNGVPTSFHVEVGTDLTYGSDFPVPDSEPPPLAGQNKGLAKSKEPLLTTHSFTQEVSDLSPLTEYHYRVVAKNAAGVTAGPDHVFVTFAPQVVDESCPNALARQQTGAASLLDCRAYELVSATDTGGYDVRSALSAGVVSLPAYPDAADRALYSMQSGTIPGIAGNPTNKGADPYVATRGAADGRPDMSVCRPTTHPRPARSPRRSSKPTPRSTRSRSAGPTSARPALPTAPPTFLFGCPTAN